MSDPLRIVSVAASQGLRAVLGGLGDGVRATHTDDIDHALAECGRIGRVVAVIDVRATGLDVLARMAGAEHGTIAVVADDAAGMSAIQAGADDFLAEQDLGEDMVRRTLAFADRHAGMAWRLRRQLREEYRTRLEETVDEMRTSLVRRLGDRYRAPVEALRSGLDVLRGLELDADAAEARQRIEDATARLEGLARQATVAFDTMSGAATARVTRFDAADIVQNIIDSYQRQVAKDGGRIDAALVPVSMQGDPQSTAEALEAFVRGAVRAAIGGAVKVRMEAQADRLNVRIEDNALGRTVEDVRASMDPAIDARKDPLGDLSLFTARRLVQSLGGAVNVSSAAGRGSVVDIELPRQRPASPQAVVQVLHVEDEADDRLILQAVVRRLGLPLHVEGVATMAEAKQRLSEGGIDIVFLDMHLPDASPDETLDAIRTWSRWLPVVAITGDESQEIRPKALGAGSRDFIKKERLTDRAVLVSLMRSALVNRTIMQAVNRA